MATVKSTFPDVVIPAMALDEFIMEKFDSYGESVAMVDGIQGQSYTYRQIPLLVRKIRFSLDAMGFRQGDVFAISSPNCLEYALVVLGVISAGGVVMLVNPQYEDEIVNQLRKSDAKYLITIPPLADTVLEAREQLSNLKEVFVFGDYPGCTSYLSLLDNDGRSLPRSKVNVDDVVLFAYTSGTTGLPKGVMLTHMNIVGNISQCLSDHLVKLEKDTDCVMALLPFFDVFGLCVVLMQCLREGLKIVTLPQFQPESFMRTIQEHKITITYLVPPLMLFLANSPLVERYDLSSIRIIVTGAAPIGRDMMEAIAARLDVKYLIQGYGSTETSGVATVIPTSIVHYGSSGLLIPQTEMKIVDTEMGKLLGPGQDGEIWLRGPQIMKGYLKNPEATAECIDNDGFFHTGDIGHIDEEGYIWVVDRLKELIKYKENQVAPAELEVLLLTHPEVQDAAVIGVPDQSAGELPRAYVVRKTDTLTSERVGKFVADKTAPHKWLRGGVVFLDQIPKSDSGKILRRELRTHLNSSLEGAECYSN